jgi:hypothetical protein
VAGASLPGETQSAKEIVSVHVIPLGGDRCVLRGCGMTREEIARENMKGKHVKKAAKTKAKADGRLGPYKVGDAVVIRGIPYHYIGIIETLGEHTVSLAPGAVWLADSARWGSDFLKDGKVNETEPYPDGVTIGYGIIADVTAWKHALPGQK